MLLFTRCNWQSYHTTLFSFNWKYNIYRIWGTLWRGMNFRLFVNIISTGKFTPIVNFSDGFWDIELCLVDVLRRKFFHNKKKKKPEYERTKIVFVTYNTVFRCFFNQNDNYVDLKFHRTVWNNGIFYAWSNFQNILAFIGVINWYFIF